MERPIKLTGDVSVLPAFAPIPPFGYLPVNAFVITGRQPVLIDTGLVRDRERFMQALEAIVDPKDLRWIILTHDDTDHTGSIQAVMERAPQATLLTNALGALRMATWWPIPLARVRPLNPGDRIDVGDRVLAAIRPPLYDNPLTVGVYDGRSRALFSADFCGGLVPSPVEDAAEVPEEALAGGMTAWGLGDSPWVHLVDQPVFEATLDQVRKLDPEYILSTHLPPARGATERFLSLIATFPRSQPATAPDEAQYAQMLAQLGASV
jgi:hypothetical protein